MAFIVLKQTLIMAAFMLLGFILYKAKKLTVQNSDAIGNVLVYLVVSCVILSSFFVEYSSESLKEFGFGFLFAFIALVISNVAGRLFFRKDVLAEMSVGYSNIGFMTIPIITACFGSHSTFYLVGYLVMFNLSIWIYTLPRFRADKRKFQWKNIFLNQYTVVSFVGFIIFISGLGNRIPEGIKSICSQLVSLNTPLAMVLLGTYIAQCEFKNIFKTKNLVMVLLVRLVVVPLITLGVFALIPAPSEIKTTIMIAAAAPVGTIIAVYAQLYNKSYQTASLYVSVSTLLSIITLPCFVYLCERFF